MSGNPSSLTYTYLAPLLPGFGGMLERSDGAYIPCHLDNMDYQEFLTWLAAGNAAPSGWTGPTNPPPPPPPETTGAA